MNEDDQTLWRPSHAYVPGQTPRHDGDIFNFIKQGTETTPIDRLHETAAWNYGIAFLQEEYFWEAHEVLEAVWMVCPPNSAEKLFVQSTIQMANAGLKRKMGRISAALKLERQSAELASEARNRKPDGLIFER